jgi:uncharacterized protein (DUF362 family)
MLNDPVVSIQRCPDPHDEAEVDAAVREAVGLLGGLSALLMPGDTVLVKPNLVDNYDYTTGVTTNPFVVRSLVRMAKEEGARKVIVADGSRVGLDSETALAGTRMRALCEDAGAEVRDLKKDAYQVAFITNGRLFRKIRLPRTLFEADVIINVPVVKTHDSEPLTLGLKNMKGLIHETDKKRFHRWGLRQCVLDLNKVALPHLTVYDGTIGMEGAGPVYGTPANLGLLLASFDTLAGDAITAAVVGYGPEELPYLAMARDQGLGTCDLDRIRVVGKGIEEVKRPFKRIDLSMDRYRDHGIRVVTEGACSGCNQFVESFFIRLVDAGRLDEMKGATVVFGQTVRLPETPPPLTDVIRVGTCTKKIKADGDYLPGCPPHIQEFKALMEARAKRKQARETA